MELTENEEGVTKPPITVITTNLTQNNKEDGVADYMYMAHHVSTPMPLLSYMNSVDGEAPALRASLSNRDSRRYIHPASLRHPGISMYSSLEGISSIFSSNPYWNVYCFSSQWLVNPCIQMHQNPLRPYHFTLAPSDVMLYSDFESYIRQICKSLTLVNLSGPIQLLDGSRLPSLSLTGYAYCTAMSKALSLEVHQNKNLDCCLALYHHLSQLLRSEDHLHVILYHALLVDRKYLCDALRTYLMEVMDQQDSFALLTLLSDATEALILIPLVQMINHSLLFPGALTCTAMDIAHCIDECWASEESGSDDDELLQPKHLMRAEEMIKQRCHFSSLRQFMVFLADEDTSRETELERYSADSTHARHDMPEHLMTSTTPTNSSARSSPSPSPDPDDLYGTRMIFRRMTI